MRNTIVVILSFVLGGCSAAARAGEIRPLDRPAMRSIVDRHDEARHGVSPVVDPPLTSLAWNDHVAQVAREWAMGCSFTHNPHRGNFGENLFATSVEDPRAAAEQAVAAWVAEKKDYDYAKNRCAEGKTCGHYTQVVWHGTRQFGCGVAACTSGSPLKGNDHWSRVVCDYGPPGNIVGEKPY